MEKYSNINRRISYLIISVVAVLAAIVLIISAPAAYVYADEEGSEVKIGQTAEGITGGAYEVTFYDMKVAVGKDHTYEVEEEISVNIPETLRQIVKERSPRYMPEFEKTMDRSNKSAGYNMFITRWKHFDDYSAWLFDILFEVERRVPPTDDPVQSRIYGYMSERLINVFCEHHRLRVCHVPLIMPIDDYRQGLNISNLRATCRNIKNDIIYKLS